jgi:hypothetical protein
MSGLSRICLEPSPDCARRRYLRFRNEGRLPPGAVCHVAYIDVKANPSANELARKAADETARGFKCGKDEVKVIGESGRAVELATRR